MTVAWLEVLVEEASMEIALETLLPRIVPGTDFVIRRFNGKQDLLRKLPQRLSGYKQWVATNQVALVVVTDRDDDDCHLLADAAGIPRASVATSTAGVVLNRIAVEELEAWFFGDTAALVTAYPGVPETLATRAKFREPDDVKGGTWEALERVLQAAGHHRGGLAKIRAARDISLHMDVESNSSQSFAAFRDGVRFVTRGKAVA
jgi:hypothetical protein